MKRQITIPKSKGERKLLTRRNSLRYFENRELSIAFNYSSLALQ